jgi:hypothetical protein
MMRVWIHCSLSCPFSLYYGSLESVRKLYNPEKSSTIEPMRRRYEIEDEERIVIEPFMPPTRKPQGGRPPKDRCQMLNAVLWIVLIGARS